MVRHRKFPRRPRTVRSGHDRKSNGARAVGPIPPPRRVKLYFSDGTVSSPPVFIFRPMSLKTKVSAGLGLFVAATSLAAFPIADAAAQTAPAVSKNVRTYVAPNGKGYVIVLLKNGKYSFRQKGGKVSARTFPTSSAALRYVAANNRKTVASPTVAPVATPVKAQIQTPAPVSVPVVVPTPVYVAPPDTSTRAS